MVLTLAIILALVLPYPANLVVLVLGAAGEVGEIVWGRRLAKRWRPKVGAETMIGQTAEVVEACRPVGQVRVHGELWEARCAAGAAVGETVRIAALEGLTLTVAPVSAGESTVTPGTPGSGEPGR
jgi:membrane protein implicated in regulation of membrane protease activity